MIAPFALSLAIGLESTGGTSMAKLTSIPPVERISFASYQFFWENGMQYIGNSSIGGLLPYRESSSAARSKASGCCRNASQPGGAPAGSGPDDGCASYTPLHVTDLSPRMLMVSSALSWPALGIPTLMPNCCCTLGSDAVTSILPNSIGNPTY